MIITNGDHIRVTALFSGQQSDPMQVHGDFLYETGGDVDVSVPLADWDSELTTIWGVVSDQWAPATVLEQVKIQKHIPGNPYALQDGGTSPILSAGTNPNLEALPAQCAVFWYQPTTQVRVQKRQWLPAPTEQALVNGLWQSGAVLDFSIWLGMWTSTHTVGARTYQPRVFSRTNQAFYELAGSAFVKSTAGTIRGRAL